jgi:outer membrane protein, heavy metal efflux system
MLGNRCEVSHLGLNGVLSCPIWDSSEPGGETNQQLSNGTGIANNLPVTLCLASLLALLLAPGDATQLTAKPDSSTVSASPTSSLDAQSPDGGPKLTIEQALELAEKYSPILSGASAQVAGARAAIQTASAYFNPRIYTFQGKQSARPVANPGVPGLLQQYGVSQIVELPNVRRTRIRVADLGRASSETGIAAVRLAVRADVKHAFYEVLRRREEISHAEENLRLLEDLRRRTGVQVNVGEAAKLELTRAEAEIAIGQNAVKTARLLYVAGLSALRAVVSAPLADNVFPEGTLDPFASLPALDKAREDMLANHPVMVQARTEVERARAQMESEKAQRLPEFTLDASYSIQPDLRYSQFGFSIPVPLVNRRKGPIAEAAAAVTRAEATLNQRRLELSASLESAYGQYLVADQQVRSFESGALRQANSAVEAAQAAYRLGARGIIEVLDAQRVLQRVRGDLLDAQYERENALIGLQELGAVK